MLGLPLRAIMLLMRPKMTFPIVVLSARGALVLRGLFGLCCSSEMEVYIVYCADELWAVVGSFEPSV